MRGVCVLATPAAGPGHGRAIGSAAAASSLRRARARQPPRRAGVRSLPSGSGSVLLLYGVEETYFLGTVEAFFWGIHDGYDVGQEGGAGGSASKEGRADSR